MDGILSGHPQRPPLSRMARSEVRDRIATRVTDMTRLGSLVLAGCLLTGCNAGSTADSAGDAARSWKLADRTYDGRPQMADMEWVVAGDHDNIRLDGQLHPDPHMITLEPVRRQIDVFHHETPLELTVAS